MNTQQPIALVTGSGSGIGREIAIELAEAGYRVILNSRSADPARTESGAYEVKATIEGKGGRADVVKADIGTPAGRQAILDFIDAQCGRLDLLVNNAGVAPR
jgi:NAD(P)-dependent dehydrogenase (short-subunit alcohol dehydrogenase family)